jgi:hypothetical protein
MEQYPMGRQMAAEAVAQANVNLMENLFDQGNPNAAWDRLNSFKEESKSDDYVRARDRWEDRMHYLAAQILILRDNIGEADAIIQDGLKETQKEHKRKREGCFLRLLGELQIRRKESEHGISNLIEAIQILKDVGNPRQLWQAHSSLAQAFAKVDRPSESREQWRAAASVVESTAAELHEKELRETFMNAAPIREILEQADR